MYYLFYNLSSEHNPLALDFSNMYLSQECKKVCAACPTTEEWGQNQNCSLCSAGKSPF